MSQELLRQGVIQSELALQAAAQERERRQAAAQRAAERAGEAQAILQEREAERRAAEAAGQRGRISAMVTAGARDAAAQLAETRRQAERVGAASREAAAAGQEAAARRQEFEVAVVALREAQVRERERAELLDIGRMVAGQAEAQAARERVAQAQLRVAAGIPLEEIAREFPQEVRQVDGVFEVVPEVQQTLAARELQTQLDIRAASIRELTATPQPPAGPPPGQPPPLIVEEVRERPVFQTVSVHALPGARTQLEMTIERGALGPPAGVFRGPDVVSTVGVRQAVPGFEPFVPAPTPLDVEQAERELAVLPAPSPERREALESFIAGERFKVETGIRRVEIAEQRITEETFRATRIPLLGELAAGTVGFLARAAPTGPLVAGPLIAKAAGRLTPEQEEAGRQILLREAAGEAIGAALLVVPGAALRPVARRLGAQVPPLGKSVAEEIRVTERGQTQIAFRRIRTAEEPTPPGEFQIATFAEGPRGGRIPVEVRGEVTPRGRVAVETLRVEQVPPRAAMVPPPPRVDVQRVGREVVSPARIPEEFAGPRAVAGQPTEFFPVRPGTRIPLADVRAAPPPRPPPFVESQPPVRVPDVRRAEVVTGFADLPTVPGLLVIPRAAPQAQIPRLVARQAAERQAAAAQVARAGGPLIVEGRPVAAPPLAIPRQRDFPAREERVAVGLRAEARQAAAPVAGLRQVSGLRQEFFAEQVRPAAREVSIREQPPIVRGRPDVTPLAGIATGALRDVGRAVGLDVRQRGAIGLTTTQVQRQPPRQPPPERIPEPPLRTPPSRPLSLPLVGIPPRPPAREPTRREPRPVFPREFRRLLIPRASAIQVLVTEARLGVPRVAARARQPAPTRATVRAFARGVRRLGPFLEFPTQQQIEAGALRGMGGRRRAARRRRR